MSRLIQVNSVFVEKFSETCSENNLTLSNFWVDSCVRSFGEEKPNNVTGAEAGSWIGSISIKASRIHGLSSRCSYSQIVATVGFRLEEDESK